MAESSRRAQARLWDRPAVAWRLVALVLVAFPQLTISPMPPIGGRDDAMGESEPGEAFLQPADATEASVVLVREAGGAEAWFDYLAHSGLILLVLAVAFILPGRSGRQAAFAATWALLLCGLIAGYAARSAVEVDLWAYCLFYLSAAALLTITGMRSALTRT
jgi:hypothetical protein